MPWMERNAGPIRWRTDGGRRARAVLARGTVLTCGVALVLAGCSDDPTDPENGNGEQGSMEATARDDAGTAQSAQAFDLSQETDGEVNGQVTGEATVEVRTGDGTWEEVGTMAGMNMETELQGSSSSSMGSAEVEAGTYGGVRVVLEGVEADVESGSEIGVGPIEVSVTVSVAGGGDVVVEHDAPFTVEADATTEVALDVGSQAWLDEGAVEAEAVTAAEFESAASVVVE